MQKMAVVVFREGLLMGGSFSGENSVEGIIVVALISSLHSSQCLEFSFFGVMLSSVCLAALFPKHKNTRTNFDTSSDFFTWN